MSDATPSDALIALVDDAIKTLRRQRTELRELYRRFAKLGERELGELFTLVAGRGVGAQLRIVTVTIEVESEVRAGALARADARAEIDRRLRDDPPAF